MLLAKAYAKYLRGKGIIVEIPKDVGIFVKKLPSKIKSLGYILKQLKVS